MIYWSWRADPCLLCGDVEPSGQSRVLADAPAELYHNSSVSDTWCGGHDVVAVDYAYKAEPVHDQGNGWCCDK